MADPLIPATSDAQKLTALRELAEQWAADAFALPNDPVAQTCGNCATRILMITDP